MPSYSPEAIEAARRPTFNNHAASIFEGGVVTPAGLKAVDLGTAVALADQPAAPVSTVAITTAGTGLSDGQQTGLATTATKGVGGGLTVDVTIAGGAVTVATANAKGSNYVAGDTVSVAGLPGVVLTVAI